MTEHAKISPSAAARWMRCPGSIKLTESIPDEETSYSVEGTKAHELAEMALERDCSMEFLAEQMRDDYSYDEYGDEMFHHVGRYVDYCYALGGRRWVELRLDLGEYIPNSFGTADCVVLDGDHLQIVDLKYGMNKVDVYNNEQLYLYALGALSKVRDKVSKVTVHIVQPRINHFDSHTLTVAELDQFGERVSVAADLCLEDNAPLNPSEKACQWCRAKATCPALYEHNLKVVGDDFDPIPVEQLSDEQLRVVIDNKALIEKWLKAVEARVFGILESGGEFSGYKMVEGRSLRKWSENAEDVLVKLLGDGAYDKKLINITAAEKLIGKKQFNELGITEKPQGKPTLAPESDKRKAISISDDFEKLER